MVFVNNCDCLECKKLYRTKEDLRNMNNEINKITNIVKRVEDYIKNNKDEIEIKDQTKLKEGIKTKLFIDYD